MSIDVKDRSSSPIRRKTLWDRLGSAVLRSLAPESGEVGLLSRLCQRARGCDGGVSVTMVRHSGHSHVSVPHPRTTCERSGSPEADQRPHTVPRPTAKHGPNIGQRGQIG